MPPVAADPCERFMRLVVWNGDEDECWEWAGAKNRGGYGVFQWGVRDQAPAHRASYELFNGPIPDGLHLDHTCHNNSDCAGGSACLHRACVNPAHLEPVTPRENILRGRGRAADNISKTHCPRGHAYAGDNLYASAEGKRACRRCRRDARRRYEARSRWPG